MDDKKELLVTQFCNITGSDRSRALFFLEPSSWNLELALATFYDEPIEMEEDEDLEPLDSPPPVLQQLHEHKKAQTTSKPQSKIRTLGDMKNAESSSDEEGQAFYAGGSERGGGQQIIGPKKKSNTSNLVADLFQNAKEHGAEVIDNSSSIKPSTSRSVFQGRAYKIGEPGVVSSVVDAPNNTKEDVDIVFKFWKNGLSIDDGPLRDFHDLDTSKLLEEIRKGQIPQELKLKHPNKTINVTMQQNSQQEYVKAKHTMTAFSGSGQRLGNPTDPISFQNSNTAMPTAVISEENLEAAANLAVHFDNAQPIVTFQIRLLDGTRMTLKLNECHNIADIRTYIIIIRPDYLGIDFVFMTTFPSRQLTDESVSLKEAGLNNNQIIMKPK